LTPGFLFVTTVRIGQHQSDSEAGHGRDVAADGRSERAALGLTSRDTAGAAKRYKVADRDARGVLISKTFGRLEDAKGLSQARLAPDL
jgi:hypothetical protein